MTHDTAGLEVLSEAECFTLAATARMGRIVFTDRAMPAVWPVTFTTDGESMILCAPAGSKLAARINETVIAFEVDEFAYETRTGWSVTFLGIAETVTDRALIARLTALGLTPLGQEDAPHFIKMLCVQATGRRIPGGPAAEDQHTPALRHS